MRIVEGADWAADTSMQRATRTLPARYQKSPADRDLRQAEKNTGWKKGEARGRLREQHLTREIDRLIMRQREGWFSDEPAASGEARR
jgi:hypothetical protein